MRSYPLLVGSIIGGDAFAPALLHGSIEMERVAWKLGLTSIGVASLYDWARTSGRPDSVPESYSSFGIGARIHAGDEILRFDDAMRPDGRFIWSAGWVESW